jgi:hypothetical protein
MKLRSHLIALVLASLLPVLLFAGVIIHTEYQQQHATIERGMIDTARALSLAVDRELQASIRTLEALATSEHITSGDLGKFYRSGEAVIQAIPGWQSIALVDPSGQQLFNLRVPFGTKTTSCRCPGGSQTGRSEQKACGVKSFPRRRGGDASSRHCSPRSSRQRLLRTGIEHSA